MSRGTIVGNCGETSGTLLYMCLRRGEKKADVADFSGTVQGFSGNYSDHFRGDLRISWRCGECDCNLCSYYDECDSWNGADGEGGAVAE